MGPARIYPWRRMHPSRAPSIAPGTFFVTQSWAGCITNMPGFNLRQAQLYETGDTIKTVYFPISAAVSLVVTLAIGEMTESAMVGKDGAVGIASALDGKIAMCRAIVQLGGDAMVCDPAAFRGAALQSKSLIAMIMRHEQ